MVFYYIVNKHDNLIWSILGRIKVRKKMRKILFILLLMVTASTTMMFVLASEREYIKKLPCNEKSNAPYKEQNKARVWRYDEDTFRSTPGEWMTAERAKSIKEGLEQDPEKNQNVSFCLEHF